MKLRKVVKYILYAGIAISILFACCALLFRVDNGISEFQHNRVLIGPPSLPLEAGITAEWSAMSTSDIFSAQVFFGAHANADDFDYFEIAVHTADFAVSMDVPQTQAIGEDGYDWERFDINGTVEEAADLPFDFQISLDPVWDDGDREGAIEIEIAMLTTDNRGKAVTSVTLYYCGSEKNVCFSTRSPEHARWLLWCHDL